MAAPTVLVFENESSVSENLCKFVADKANDAIKRKNIFTVGVSGKNYLNILLSLCMLTTNVVGARPAITSKEDNSSCLNSQTQSQSRNFCDR